MHTANSPHLVRQFREILFWPIQLVSAPNTKPHWESLNNTTNDNPWSLLADRFQAEPSAFEERHYKEFAAFLPYVQRFIYGESRGRFSHGPDDPPGDSAIKIFRRQGVAALRLTIHEGDTPIVLDVEHIELWFFDDINVAFLKVELAATDLAFDTACDLLYRFGRAYPTGWDNSGQGKHNVYRAEWLATSGEVLAQSDSANQEHFLRYTHQHRSPGIAAHWDFLLRPLVLDSSEQAGLLRYRQIEYHRMPLMAFLALEQPRQLSRQDWLRLGMVTTRHPDENLPTDDKDMSEFEATYCYDRFWSNSDSGTNTRFICTGRAFIVTGDANAAHFHDRNRGILAQFRHQYVLLFLIAHFHRASLLVFSDRMVDAIHDLDIQLAQSISRFRRRIYGSFEAFLRFTHRYWFHQLSERVHVQALFEMCSRHLNNEALYQEVKQELRDMSQYLDSNSQRQQSTTIVRLTVVTTFSMVGTVATGLLGMNLIAAADDPVAARISYFLLTILVVAILTLLAILKSKQLSDVMDLLADDQKRLSLKLSQLGKVWQRRPPR